MIGQSGLFTVNPGALASFIFSTISSPQTAGTAFSITITAYDEYGNVMTNYAGPAVLTDFSGSLTEYWCVYCWCLDWFGDYHEGYANDVITVLIQVQALLRRAASSRLTLVLWQALFLALLVIRRLLAQLSA